MNENIITFAKRMDNCDDKLKLLKYIPQKEDLTIVDFGAGTGIVSIEIAKHFPKSKIIAIEDNIDMQGILLDNIIKEKLVFKINVSKNLNNIKPNSVDVFIFSAVIHELEIDFNEFWKTIYNLLKPNGKVIIRDRRVINCYDNKTLTVRFNDKSNYNLAKEFYCIHYENMRSVTFNDLALTIQGNYYQVYAPLFSITFGIDSFNLREKYEFPFVDSSKLPNNLKVLEQENYVKYDTIKHFSKFCNIINGYIAPTNSIIVYTKE